MLFIAVRAHADGEVEGASAVRAFGENKAIAPGTLLWNGPWWAGDQALQQKVRVIFERALSGERVSRTLKITTPLGPEVVEAMAAPLRKEQNIVGVSLLCVAARDAAGAASDRDRLALAIEAAEMGIFDLDMATGSVWMDERTRALVSPTRTTTNTFDDLLKLLDPRDVQATRSAVEGAMTSESKRFSIVVRLARRTGSGPTALRVMGRVLGTEGDTATRSTRFVGLVRDVSAEQTVDAQSRKNHERLALAMQAVNGLVYEWDMRTGQVVHSESTRGLLVDTPSPRAGSPGWWAAQVYPDDLEVVRQALSDAVAERHDQMSSEYRVRHRDGRWVWVADYARIIYSPSGEPESMTGCLVSIDDRKNAAIEREKLLSEVRLQAEQLELAQSAGGVGIWAWDKRTDWSDWSASSAAILGLPNEPISQGGGWALWVSRLHPEDRDRVVARLKKILETDATIWREDFRALVPNGQVRWVETTGRIVRNARGEITGMFGVNLDITRRKRVEEGLRESERRFRAALENADVVVFEQDRDLRYTWVYNPRMPKFGAEVLGRTDAEMLSENEAAVLTKLKSKALRTGEAVSADVEVTDSTTGKAQVWRARFEPIRIAHGQITGLICSAVDITHHMRLERELRAHRDGLEDLVRQRTDELRQANNRLRVADRMASIGQLATGLGHDLNNLLIPMRMRLDAMASGDDLSAPLREDIEALRHTCTYLARLSSGLRLFTKNPDAADAQRVTYLQAWMRAVEPFLRTVLPLGVRLKMVCDDPALCAQIEPHRLTQAVYNLVQNAANAMASHGPGLVQISALGTGGGAQVVVADTGPGMSDEVAARCMEDGFSSGREAQGLGIGLTLVRAIAQSAGGSVAMSTEPGRGTTFVLKLQGAAPLVRRVLIELEDEHDQRTAAQAVQELRFEALRPAADSPRPEILLVEGDERGWRRAAQFVNGFTDRAAVLVRAAPAPPTVQLNDRMVLIEGKPDKTAFVDAFQRVLSTLPPR